MLFYLSQLPYGCMCWLADHFHDTFNEVAKLVFVSNQYFRFL